MNSHSNRNCSSGFSLVEMMIAVAVIFIVSGIAVQAYQGYLENVRQQALMSRVEAFRMFQDNWRIDNGTYVAGNYVPGGTNDFATIGYRVPDDDDGIAFRVEACDGGTIDECYKVAATNERGDTLVWQRGAYTWAD